MRSCVIQKYIKPRIGILVNTSKYRKLLLLTPVRYKFHGIFEKYSCKKNQVTTIFQFFKRGEVNTAYESFIYFELISYSS